MARLRARKQERSWRRGGRPRWSPGGRGTGPGGRGALAAEPGTHLPAQGPRLGRDRAGRPVGRSAGRGRCARWEVRVGRRGREACGPGRCTGAGGSRTATGPGRRTWNGGGRTGPGGSRSRSIDARAGRAGRRTATGTAPSRPAGPRARSRTESRAPRTAVSPGSPRPRSASHRIGAPRV